MWKTFDVNLTWVMSFDLQKVEYFCFYTVYMDPIVIIYDFEVIFTSQNVFYVFFKKKLEVVTIARYLNAFWFFEFSLLDILPKYMNPKLMSRSLYVTDDLPEKTRTSYKQTDKPTDIIF